MAKIALSIKTSYLPTWGTYEGVRELVQNARDAEIEHDAKMTVEYVNGLIRIENDGTVLPHQALLMGHTTKLDRTDTIGKFGEGLKLGVLALVRAGHTVKIRSGNEVWAPALQYSTVFKADVLTFDITGGRQSKNRVRIEIGGVAESVWNEMRKNFLFLDTVAPETQVSTDDGTLLLGEAYRGKVYVKGIFVQSLPDLQFGYDLRDADLDRDRKMIESWNLQYKTRGVLMAALTSRSELNTQFNALLANPTPEVQSIDSYSSYTIPESTRTFVYDAFVAEHGTTAVPVQSASEAQDVEALGVKGVVVTRQQLTVLQTRTGDLSAIKIRLAQEAMTTHAVEDLSTEEQSALHDAMALIGPVANLSLDDVSVVDFRSQTMQSQSKDNRIRLSRTVLTDPDTTLQVLIREAANLGSPLTPQIEKVEALWKAIVINLRRTSRFERT